MYDRDSGRLSLFQSDQYRITTQHRNSSLYIQGLKYSRSQGCIQPHTPSPRLRPRRRVRVSFSSRGTDGVCRRIAEGELAQRTAILFVDHLDPPAPSSWWTARVRPPPVLAGSVPAGIRGKDHTPADEILRSRCSRRESPANGPNWQFRLLRHLF